MPTFRLVNVQIGLVNSADAVMLVAVFSAQSIVVCAIVTFYFTASLLNQGCGRILYFPDY